MARGALGASFLVAERLSVTRRAFITENIHNVQWLTEVSSKLYVLLGG